MWKSCSSDLQTAGCVPEFKSPWGSKIPCVFLPGEARDGYLFGYSLRYPSQGIDRTFVRHGPYWGRMRTRVLWSLYSCLSTKRSVQVVWVTSVGVLPLGDPGHQSWLVWGIFLPWMTEILCARPRSSWKHLLEWIRSPSCLCLSDASGN